MRIGLIDVDGHNFPNLALMRISAYHKPNAPAEVKRLQRWVNNKIIFRATKKFEEFKG